MYCWLDRKFQALDLELELVLGLASDLVLDLVLDLALDLALAAGMAQVAEEEHFAHCFCRRR